MWLCKDDSDYSTPISKGKASWEDNPYVAKKEEEPEKDKEPEKDTEKELKE